MPRIIVRKGYRCLPGEARGVLAALQRVDEAAAGAGWPAGATSSWRPAPPASRTWRWSSPSSPTPRWSAWSAPAGSTWPTRAEVALAGQEHLLEPSHRHLLLLDEPGHGLPRQPAGRRHIPAEACLACTRRGAVPGPGPGRAGRAPPASPSPPEAGPDPHPATGQAAGGARPGDGVGRGTAGVPLEKRSSQRRQAPPPPAPDEPDGMEGKTKATLSETAWGAATPPLPLPAAPRLASPSPVTGEAPRPQVGVKPGQSVPPGGVARLDVGGRAGVVEETVGGVGVDVDPVWCAAAARARTVSSCELTQLSFSL